MFNPLGNKEKPDEESDKFGSYIYMHDTDKGYIILRKYPPDAKIKRLDITTDSQMAGKIYAIQAYHAATIFLDSIWEKYKEKFSESDFDELSQLCSYLTGNPLSLDDWRCCYLKITGRQLDSPRSVYPLDFYPLLDKETMSFDTAFKAMQEDCLWHYEEFGFNFPQLIEMLNSMVTHPAAHQTEWNLWNQAIERARSGEDMGFG